MPGEKRMIDGSEVLHAVRIDGVEEIVAQNILTGSNSYRLFQCRRNNPLIEEYVRVFSGDDYLKAMREFTRRINAHLDALEVDQIYRGSPVTDAALTSADCVKGGMAENLAGKVVAIKASALSPEYRSKSHQAMLATGGFGCSPDASAPPSTVPTSILVRRRGGSGTTYSA